MTAFQTMILFSDGAPLTPAGGSSCSLNTNTTTSEYVHREIESITAALRFLGMNNEISNGAYNGYKILRSVYPKITL